MNLGLNDLIEIVTFVANKNFDGHFSIMKFTTHWKIMFGTPDLDSGSGREYVRKLNGFDELEKALWDLIINTLKNCERRIP